MAPGAPGSVFLIPPQAVHTGQSASPGGYEYRVLYLGPEQLVERSGELWHGARRPPIVVRHPELAQALRSVHSTLRLPAAALEQGEASAIVGCFVDDLTSSFRERSEPARDGHPAVQRARAYIHDRWREDVTLDELALAAGLSPFHSPAAQIGMPPSAYRRALRVQAAQRVLRAGTYRPERRSSVVSTTKLT
jgi:AraC-like ligand binding domain